MAKILVFISEGFYYLSHRKDLLQGLSKSGFQVCLATNPGEFKDEVFASGINCISVDISREKLGLLSLGSVAIKYKSIIDTVKPDLVFAVAWKPILAVLVATKFSNGIPVLCAFAGLGGAFVESRRKVGVVFARIMIENLLKIVLDRPGVHSLFQNHDDRKLFIEKTWTNNRSSSVILGAGVPLNCVRKGWVGDTGVIRFIFAGRLLVDKGICILIDACKILKENGVPYECLIAGFIDKSNRSSISEDEIKKYHNLGIVNWIGPQKDVMKDMAESDCFIFPTMYREGVPRVLLEASAVGIPIITTDIPGCRDVVEHKKNGLLIQPGSSKALASAMEYCILNKPDLRIWGDYARKKAEEQYGIENVIRSHNVIINNMLRNSGG